MMDSNDKINLIQNEIDNTKDTLRKNIDLVIERGENLEDLSEKSVSLIDRSRLFKIHSKRLKWKMFMKKVKMTALLVIILLVIIFIILFSICGIKLHCK